MALFEFFHSTEEVGPDPDSGTVAVATESQLEIVAGALTLDFYGSFAYDGAGALAGGIFTGFEFYDSAHGGLQMRASGLSVSVESFFDFASSPDPNALEEFLLNGSDTLVGSPENDSLVGYAGNDSLLGGGGNDTLVGSDAYSVDTLVGGTGDDTYLLSGAPGDVLVESPAGGVDTVVTPTEYVLGPNFENLRLDGTDYQHGTGNELANRLEANDYACALDGLGGNDTLVGGASMYETLSGGAGDDTYEMKGGDGTLIHELPGEGTDTVRSTTDFGLADNVENLVLLGPARMGSGNALDNVITGNDLGDTLDGWTGADTLIGGAGNDAFKVDQAGDVVVGGAGNDTVTATMVGDYVLPSDVEDLVFSGTTATGNSLDNFIAAAPYTYVRNVIFGLAGNDTIDGANDSDTIDGGDGLDHALYHGNLSGYTISLAGSSVDVMLNYAPVYHDTLTNIERLDFTDAHVAFDVAGNAGQAYRLYQAAFDRAPDTAGLGFWINAMDKGYGLREVSGYFLSSAEFAQKYGTNLDTQQFVTQLYANVLHRQPDAGGAMYWGSALDQKLITRADALAFFSESAENQANVVGAIQDGIVYTL